MTRSKTLYIIALFILITGFNYFYLSAIKKDTDVFLNNYVLTIADEQSKQLLQLKMNDKYYLPSDMSEIHDIAFTVYKNNLIGRDLLHEQLKNIMLLNFKIATVDSFEFKMMNAYTVNLCFIFCLLFGILYSPTQNKENYEPTLST